MQSKHEFAQELNAFMKLRSSHNLNSSISDAFAECMEKEGWD